MKVLVAEDDFASALVLEKALKREGYEVAVSQNGRLAQERLEREPFDLLLTDWMMPELDGVELIRWARKHLDPVPAIAMLTVISNPEARAHALLAGADEFIGKPCNLDDLMRVVSNLLARRRQEPPPAREAAAAPREPVAGAPLGVVLAAGSAGPEALEHLFKNLSPEAFAKACFMVVVHGPDWLVYDIASRLESEEHLNVVLPETGERPEPGTIYLAHGEKHLLLADDPLRLELSMAPPENFMRPSADVLFRSAAEVLGSNCIAVVLTGIGCDGALGSAIVAGAGGEVLVQDPESSAADAMPRSVLDMGVTATAASHDELPAVLERVLATKA